MKFERGEYTSIHFPKLNLGSHINDSLLHERDAARLTSDPTRNLEKFFNENDSLPGIELSKESDDWDQFEENEKKFHVKAFYDENKYTTVLNMGALSRKQLEDGAAIAESIQCAPSNYFHIRDDRGQVKRKERGRSASEDEEDEEKLYSAVLGTGAYKDTGARLAHKPGTGWPAKRVAEERHKADKPKEVRKSHKAGKFEKKEQPEAAEVKPAPGIPSFTNSKKHNMEMTHSIQADLGIADGDVSTTPAIHSVEEEKAVAAKQHGKIAETKVEV